MPFFKTKIILIVNNIYIFLSLMRKPEMIHRNISLMAMVEDTDLSTVAETAILVVWPPMLAAQWVETLI